MNSSSLPISPVCVCDLSLFFFFFLLSLFVNGGHSKRWVFVCCLFILFSFRYVSFLLFFFPLRSVTVPSLALRHTSTPQQQQKSLYKGFVPALSIHYLVIFSLEQTDLSLYIKERHTAHIHIRCQIKRDTILIYSSTYMSSHIAD